jgi:transposase
MIISAEQGLNKSTASRRNNLTCERDPALGWKKLNSIVVKQKTNKWRELSPPGSAGNQEVKGGQMNRPEYFVGIDIASESFTVAAGQMQENEWKIVVEPFPFRNGYDGFPQFKEWMQRNQLRPDNVIVCMEATGVYNEVLAHYLVANQYIVVIQSPLQVKRAFKPVGHKTDPVDSCQISEYAYRHYDELVPWKPRDEILEQIKVLLSSRGQFSAQCVAHQNILKALKRKAKRAVFAEKVHSDAIEHLRKVIKSIEQEIERLIDQNPHFGQTVGLLLTIPGVGLILATHMLIMLERSPQSFSPKELAAFIGICPYERQSGSSIHRPATSRHYGPGSLRGLLFLAALTLRTNNPTFKHYFFRKVIEGKPKKLVINNIANKLLKIMCAVVNSKTPYIPNYRSVNPLLLQKGALTKS